VKPRHAAALALVIFCALTAFVGCLAPVEIDYDADPSLHTAGWKCPDPDRMNRVVTHSNPPALVPGALFSKSCMDQVVADRELARGCVPEASPTPTPTPLNPNNRAAAEPAHRRVSVVGVNSAMSPGKVGPPLDAFAGRCG
jgi:hypothetical protein